ncbi:MAG: hypothetical protein H7274_05680 [Rhodoferax sp.]|nr:hypothetical protein [Rhodoferax sp.]
MSRAQHTKTWGHLAERGGDVAGPVRTRPALDQSHEVRALFRGEPISSRALKKGSL